MNNQPHKRKPEDPEDDLLSPLPKKSAMQDDQFSSLVITDNDTPSSNSNHSTSFQQSLNPNSAPFQVNSSFLPIFSNEKQMSNNLEDELQKQTPQNTDQPPLVHQKQIPTSTKEAIQKYLRGETDSIPDNLKHEEDLSEDYSDLFENDEPTFSIIIKDPKIKEDDRILNIIEPLFPSFYYNGVRVTPDEKYLIIPFSKENERDRCKADWKKFNFDCTHLNSQQRVDKHSTPRHT